MFKRLKQLAQLVSFKELRNALLGFSVVFGGLGLAALTYYAHQTGNLRLAGAAATASLVFVLLIVIFVIPPLARSANAEASQMNLPFEFTTGGAVFIGLLVIVAFAAWNTGNNLLFLVLAFTTSALVVSFLAGNLCLKKLDVKMRFPETIFAEDETPIIVSLHNRKWLFPTFSVTAEVRGKERELSRLIGEFRELLSEKWAKRVSRPPLIKYVLDYFVFIPRNDSVENGVKHVFKKRGRFIIRDFEISTQFPFAFFRHRRRLSAQKAEIIVFPKIEQIDEEMLDMPLDAGKLVSARKGAGQDLFALRDYYPMDDLRHVDWKATARSSNLMVREFSAEDDKFVTIILDTRIKQTKAEKSRTLRQKIADERIGRDLSPSAKRFEHGVRLTASLLSFFEQDGAEIRLIVNKVDSGFGTGGKHFNKCLKRLALVEPDYADEVAEANSKDIYDELFSNKPEYIYFITAENRKHLPGELIRKAKVIDF